MELANYRDLLYGMFIGTVMTMIILEVWGLLRATALRERAAIKAQYFTQEAEQCPVCRFMIEAHSDRRLRRSWSVGYTRLNILQRICPVCKAQEKKASKAKAKSSPSRRM